MLIKEDATRGTKTVEDPLHTRTLHQILSEKDKTWDRSPALKMKQNMYMKRKSWSTPSQEGREKVGKSTNIRLPSLTYINLTHSNKAECSSFSARNDSYHSYDFSIAILMQTNPYSALIFYFFRHKNDSQQQNIVRNLVLTLTLLSFLKRT